MEDLPGTGEPAGDGWAGSPDGSGEQSEPTTAPRGTSTRASTSDVREAIRGLVATLIEIVGWVLNRRLAPPGSDTWLADAQDLKVIGGAASRIAVRHSPDGLTGDVVDGLVVAVGTANYGRKNLARAAAERGLYGPPNVDSDEGEDL
jgi:hypothetical protein